MSVSVVHEFLRRRDERTSANLVDAARSGELDDHAVGELASGLARSGTRLPNDPISADLASTGGPSSLSTLLCPLFLRARGLRVPTLGVPGRPAGGIDVLQTIPGYDAALAPEAVRTVLERSGYVHLIADERWAPLDAQLFSFRQRTGAQAIASLVIASILAKKLAVGVTGAGLEVRVAPHANFGADWDTARANAGRYKVVATLLQLQPVAVLTDATRPFQPYVGRGEALLALNEVFDGRAKGWLADHLRRCAQMADAVAAAIGIEVSTPIDVLTLRREHEALLRSHGADPSAFSERLQGIRSARRKEILATTSGIVEYDLGRLRDLLSTRQRAEPHRVNGTAADPAGAILAVAPGDYVDRGELLISARVPNGEDELALEIGRCAHVTQTSRRATDGHNRFEIV